MSNFSIKSVHGREILDSRGMPTVEAEVQLRGGAVGRAAVPSGASTGSQEALELRDGDPTRYGKNGVRMAVRNINSEIAQALQLRDASDQCLIDKVMNELDGSSDGRKTRLGANAVLAVSLATAHASAKQREMSLFRYVRGIFDQIGGKTSGFKLPLPMLNFINGGAHADNALDFQEFMLVPHGASTFEDAIEWASRIYLCLLEAVRTHGGGNFASYGVGDEGGFSITTPEELSPKKNVNFVLGLLRQFVEKAGFTLGLDGQFAITLDPAATEFFENGKYVLGRRQKDKGKIEYWDSAELVGFYSELVEKYPIISIEDGMAEYDLVGWKLLTQRLGERCQLVGDDLFVTNPTIFKKGIDAGIANSILVKVNQIGTLSESLDVIRLAHQFGYSAIVSHRSGETEDTTISDIAVGVNAGQIKTGCLSRSDRTSKYNRLLEISQELGSNAQFDGRIIKRARLKAAA